VPRLRLLVMLTSPPPDLAVQIARLDPSVPVPAPARAGDAGVDLRARKALTLAPGERAAVPTGIAVAIPPGWAGLVLPRSGLARRHGIGLPNAPGLIDSGYRGEIQVLLVNFDPSESFRVEAGDRIAQLVLVPYAQARFVEVDELPVSERGDAGFGSSGRR
jgi:dUTP pyrophosphatase